MSTRSPVRVGIGLRLMLAFGTMALVTVAACGLSWIIVANINRTVTVVATNSVPALSTAIRLMAASSRIAAAAAALDSTIDQAGRDREAAAVHADLVELNRDIALLGLADGVLTENLAQIERLANNIRTNLITLDVSVQDRLDMAARVGVLRVQIDAASRELRSSLDALDLGAAESDPVRQHVARLREIGELLAGWFSASIAAGAESDVAAIRAAHGTELKALRPLLDQVAVDARFAPVITAIESLAGFGSGADDIFEARSEHLSAIASGRRTLAANRRFQRLLEGEIHKVVTAHADEVGRQADGTIAMSARGIEIFRGLSLSSLAAAIVIAWLLRHTISTRIAAISDAMARIQRSGDYAIRIPVVGRDEIADMIAGFNRMISQIADRDRQIAQDVMRRQEQEARLAEALEREREIVAQQRRFIAVAAHEFRTPLTIIDGTAQRLIRNSERISADDLRERGDRIRNAVARMSQLIDTTLNAARIDAGRIELARAEIDLVVFVRSLTQKMQAVATDFVIDVTDPGVPVRVNADPRLLEQVFSNLISNAFKYSGASRRIEIAIALDDGTARVSVTDFGIGVPADELVNLFTRFYRASTAQGLPGTGIGLNLVKELVVLHGGSVDVASRVGDGSVFTVRLPIAASDTRSDAVTRSATG